MKKFIAIACLATTVAMISGTAMADSIKGRIGITGKIGILEPADNKSDFINNKTDTGYVGGGGFIYGMDDHFAAEIDLTRATFGSETGDFGITDLSLGGQYRFAVSNRQLVPFLGVGMDILFSDYDPYVSSRNVDTTVGLHIKAGIDYFIQKQLALTAEVKIVAAHDANINDQYGDQQGNFNPSSVSSTVGIRYFFN